MFRSDSGLPACCFGNGGAFDASNLRFGDAALAMRAWSHVLAVFDSGVVSLYVNGVLQSSGSATVTAVTSATSPLRLGAYGDASGTNGFLDGDLAMPVIYSGALPASKISDRARRRPPDVATIEATGATVEGCWALCEEEGTDILDARLRGPRARRPDKRASSRRERPRLTCITT